MQPRKLKVLVTSFPYGGNGAVHSEVPDIRHWAVQTLSKAAQDPRIESILMQDFSDTPITMTRNEAVVYARENGVDVLVMIDSDTKPDSQLGRDPNAVPFFEAAFDAIYEHYEKGPLVIGAIRHATRQRST